MIKHISFAGIDNKTNVTDLIELQHDFPLVEYGVLSSKNCRDNGRRYPDPVMLKSLKDKGLNLSLHLCGEFARLPFKEGWPQIEGFYGKDLALFQRVQLNVVGYKPKTQYNLPHLAETTETIIQQKSILDMPIFESYLESDCDESIHTLTSILFDCSGGKGLYEKDFDVVEIDKLVKHGFAGGISPDNCVEVIRHIEDSLSNETRYWIDMESGVRDDHDWFSIEKCRTVCEKIYTLLNLR